MSEPRRWRDHAPDAPEGAPELLQHAQLPPQMTSEQWAQSSAFVRSLVSSPAPTGVPAFAVVMGIILVATTAAGGIWLASDKSFFAVEPEETNTHQTQTQRHGSKRRVSPQAHGDLIEPQPEPIDETLNSQEDESDPSLEQISERRDQRNSDGGTHHEGQRSQNDLEREAFLLEQARASLDSNPRQALNYARAHQMEFPRGTLSTEREIIAILALYRMGRQRQARLRADSFIRRNPNSIHVERIRRIFENR